MAVLAGVVLSGPVLAEHHEKKGDRGAKMFEKQDTNGDGVISKAEFLSHAEERFSKLDSDGNGEVTKEEAKAAHEAMKEKVKEMREKRGDAGETDKSAPE